MPLLDPEQAEAFDRDGYLVLPGVFDADEVAAMNESPWEWRYQRMKAAGEFVDSFGAAG